MDRSLLLRASGALLLGSAACTELLGSTAGDGAPPDAAGCGAPVRAASLLNDTLHEATITPYGALVDGAGNTYVYGAWHACRSPTSGYDAYVMRFRPDGSLDEGFADRGRFCDGLNEGAADRNAALYAMAIDARGRLVLAGLAANASRDVSGYLLRLDPNGRPDLSLGPGGVLLPTLPGGAPAAFYAMIADGDGLVLAGGDANAFGPSTLGFLWRLREDGSPDPAFAQGAPVVDTLGGAFVALAQVPAGYAVASPSRATSQTRVSVFDRAGSLVTRFGVGGVATTAARFVPRWLRADAAGRIAVGGAAIDPRGWLLRVARFDRDGRADTGFGEGGLRGDDALFVDPGPCHDVCDLTCDGRVTCAGRDRGFGVTMVRWLADGRLDPSFGTGGYLSLPGLLEPRAAAVDPRDGSTLVLTRSGSDLAIAVQLWRIPP